MNRQDRVAVCALSDPSTTSCPAVPCSGLFLCYATLPAAQWHMVVRQVYTREDRATLLLPWLFGVLGAGKDDGGNVTTEASQVRPV